MIGIELDKVCFIILKARQLDVKEGDKVPGSGILTAHFSDGATLPLRDYVRLMIALSDNTATNLLIDKVSIRRSWEKMEALGLPRTKLHSKSFLRMTSVAMDSSVKYGLGVLQTSVAFWLHHRGLIQSKLFRDGGERLLLDHRPHVHHPDLHRDGIDAAGN